MKALLVAINAKFIHTSLAVRDIYQCSKNSSPCALEMVEFTINQRVNTIIDEIYRKKPDILLFSCYIWNVTYISHIVTTYRKLNPDAKIFVGGPEVSYHPKDFLADNPAVDAVIKAEGEVVIPSLLAAIHKGEDISCVRALVYRDKAKLIETAEAGLFTMSSLPFPYEDIEEINHRIFYFESLRGCPFRCSYCLSSLAGGVRFMPLEQVKAQLSIFLAHKVRQVKFVDRTFNCSKAHAMAIWQFLKEHDNGVTNFHFEIAAHLLDREMLDFLKTVRPEQFQLEVGVQSTNPATIAQIQRATDTDSLLDICSEIDSFQNIHQHLDLIAGLPYEDIASFERSFNRVFAIRPQQLQLGFLKILKGSQMEREVQEHDIQYSHIAPFEVLSTKWLTYDDVLLLKGVEEMVEKYYNSGRFEHSLECLLQNQPSAYKFFEDFGAYYFANGHHLAPMNKEQSHTVLKQFHESRGEEYSPQLFDAVLFDICLKEKPKKFPSWLNNHWMDDYKQLVSTFFGNKEYVASYLPQYTAAQSIRASQRTHLQIFSHDVTQKSMPEELTYLLFDYDHTDLLGNAKCIKLPQELFA